MQHLQLPAGFAHSPGTHFATYRDWPFGFAKDPSFSRLHENSHIAAIAQETCIRARTETFTRNSDWKRAVR